MPHSLLVTGADGFTGRHFCRAAKEQGFAIHALDADLCDSEAITAELAEKSFDYVVHLAAIAAVTHADELALYQVNLFGTLNFLQAVASLKQAPRKVIVASSANIYGNAEHSPINEQAAPAPVNHYAMSKLSMEYMLDKYRAQLPLIIVRPFNYTGAGQDDRFIIPKLVKHFAEREPRVEMGNISVEREFNDVRFVCEAYLGLLEKGESSGVYNVCSGKTYSLTEIVSLLGELSGHTLEVGVNPAFVRKDEVHRLCGDPTRLENCLGKLNHPPLKDTLQWMLEANIS